MADRRELPRGERPDVKQKIAAMSDAAFAAIDFEAWQHKPDEWVPPSDKEWADQANPFAFTLRCAWAMMHLTKPEMIDAVAVLDADGGEQNPATETLASLQNTERHFEMLHSIVREALTRFLIAATANELRKAT